MTEPCGAIKKDGTPCKQLATYENGRCKWHGGLATGPKTEAGKAQSRINGCKGGRPRKDGRETQSHGEGNIGITLETVETVATPVQKTEITDTEEIAVSAEFSGEVLGMVAEPEMSILAHVSSAADLPESSPEKPKSWMSKEVKVLPLCECCTMFAGSGACLAVAKGIIPSVPSGGDCPGFIDFETA